MAILGVFVCDSGVLSLQFTAEIFQANKDLAGTIMAYASGKMRGVGAEQCSEKCRGLVRKWSVLFGGDMGPAFSQQQGSEPAIVSQGNGTTPSTSMVGIDVPRAKMSLKRQRSGDSGFAVPVMQPAGRPFPHSAAAAASTAGSSSPSACGRSAVSPVRMGTQDSVPAASQAAPGLASAAAEMASPPKAVGVRRYVRSMLYKALGKGKSRLNRDTCRELVHNIKRRFGALYPCHFEPASKDAPTPALADNLTDVQRGVLKDLLQDELQKTPLTDLLRSHDLAA